MIKLAFFNIFTIDIHERQFGFLSDKGPNVMKIIIYRLFLKS